MSIKRLLPNQTAAVLEPQAVIWSIPAGKIHNFVSEGAIAGVELVQIRYLSSESNLDSHPLVSIDGDLSLSTTKSFQPITGPMRISVGKTGTAGPVGCHVFF